MSLLETTRTYQCDVCRQIFDSKQNALVFGVQIRSHAARQGVCGKDLNFDHTCPTCHNLIFKTIRGLVQ